MVKHRRKDLICEPLILKAFTSKWKKVTRKWFLASFVGTFLYLCLFSFAGMYWRHDTDSASDLHQLGNISLLICSLLSFFHLIVSLSNASKLGCFRSLKTFKQRYSGPALLSLCAWLHAIFFVPVIPISFTGHKNISDAILAISAVFGWTHLLYFGIGTTSRSIFLSIRFANAKIEFGLQCQGCKVSRGRKSYPSLFTLLLCKILEFLLTLTFLFISF